MHAVAIRPCYREDLKETWTQEGLSSLRSAITANPQLPEMRQAPDSSAEGASRRKRVNALADQVGPPGKNYQWQASRLRPEALAPPSAPTVECQVNQPRGGGDFDQAFLESLISGAFMML